MKSPAFRFYPSDFWGSPDVQAMELHEVGAYLSLLSNAWLSDRPGYLTDDDEKLRRWSKMTRDQWAVSRSTLMAKFPPADPGFRWNPRLVLESQKQLAFSASRAANGRKGGRPPKAAENHLLSNPNHLLSDSKLVDYPAKASEKPSVSVSVSVKDKDSLPPSEAHVTSLPKPTLVTSEATQQSLTDKDVEAIRLAYPRKEAAIKARKAIRAAHSLLVRGAAGSTAAGKPLDRMAPEAAAAFLAAAVQTYARSPLPERNYIPYPAKWFNDGRYLETAPTEPQFKVPILTATEKARQQRAGA